MKRVIIKSVIFLLVLSMSLPIMSAKEERMAEAAFVIDDILVSYIVAGVCVSLGCFAVASSSSPHEIFTDMFGPYALDNIRDYFKELDETKATGYLANLSESLRQSVILVKKEHKHAVVHDASGYKYIDDTGNVVVTDMELPFSSGSYYFTDVLPASDPAYTSGNTISKEAVEYLKTAVATVSKPFVQLGKTMIDDIVDFVGASGVFAKNDTSSLAASARYNEITSKYEGKTALVVNFGNVNAYGSVVSDVTAIAIEGVILELRLQNGSRLFQTMSADRFSEMNDLYSKSGDIHVFSDYMSSSLIFGGRGYFYSSGCSDMLYGAYNDNISSLIEISCSDGNTVFRATSCTANERYCYPPYYRYASIDSGAATFINNGATANYVIGEVGADGTISYSVYGETTEGKFIDGLDIGSTSVKVTGDVTVSDRILEQIMDNNLTVEDINNEIAGVNDNVIAIDNTVSDGFSKSNSWLEKIWNGVTSIPSVIKAGFSSLWNWLSDILSAIKDVPVDIVAGLVTVGNNILDIPTDIVAGLVTVGNNILDIPADIVAGLDKVGSYILDIPIGIADAIGDIAVDVGDFVVSIPGDISDTIDEIKTTLKSIPVNILNGLKNLLIELFVPGDNFFNNWGNKFKNSLRDKLPLDVFTDFMEDIKDITSARAENITVNIYGQEVTVLSFDWYYKYKNNIDDVIKGCTFVLLVFYNINMVYFAIRGTKLFNLNSFEGDLYYIQQNIDKIL